MYVRYLQFEIIIVFVCNVKTIYLSPYIMLIGLRFEWNTLYYLGLFCSHHYGYFVFKT